MSELVKVIIKLPFLNVHDIIANRSKVCDCCGKLVEYLNNSSTQGLTFGVTDINFSKSCELNNGRSEVHYVLASFREGIKSYEEGTCCDFPLALRLDFVFKINIFES